MSIEKMRLGPVKRTKTYELVVRQIKNEIFEGRLRPGDHLPGERQLSELLHVSRPSVREAIRILEALEIVRSRPGNSAGSGLIISTEPSRALTDLLGVHVALSSYSISEVVTVRMSLEVQSARSTAEHINTTDVSRVREILEQMNPELDRESFLDLDAQFHVELAQCANNALLADLMSALREAVRRPMAEAFDNDAKWPEWSRILVKEHNQIFDAVCAGDADRAEAMIREHIDGFYERAFDESATTAARAVNE